MSGAQINALTLAITSPDGMDHGRGWKTLRKKWQKTQLFQICQHLQDDASSFWCQWQYDKSSDIFLQDPILQHYLVCVLFLHNCQEPTRIHFPSLLGVDLILKIDGLIQQYDHIFCMNSWRNHSKCTLTLQIGDVERRVKKDAYFTTSLESLVQSNETTGHGTVVLYFLDGSHESDMPFTI